MPAVVFSINIKGRRAGSCEPTYEKENIKITCSVLFLWYQYILELCSNRVEVVKKS